MISILSEAYFAGVSTCKMNKLFMDLGLENIDHSFVSRCAAQIDKELRHREKCIGIFPNEMSCLRLFVLYYKDIQRIG